MRRFFAVLITAFAVAGTAVAGFSAAGVVGGKATTHKLAETTINVNAFEFSFTFSQSSAPAGIIHFVVKNTGTQEHDLSIAGQGTPTIEPGQSATLTVTLNPGSYNYACTIGEHATFGMQGTFTVTGTPVTTTTVITTGGTTRTITTTQTTTPTTTTPRTTVAVSEKEFKIILPSIKKRVAYYVRVKGKRVKRFKTVLVQKPLKAGPTHFVIKNIGKVPHNFVIAGQQSLVIAAGQTGTLDVDLSKGKQKYLCSITGHAALGMKGTATVV